jgi:hypothetical protein
MVNRPDSSSTRSDKSSSSNRSYQSSMKNNRGGFVRSRSGTDYSDKNGKIKTASSLQNISKTNSGARARGMKKYKSNGR